ncbi:unnamed protein product, partial [Ixodes hexagonus]
RALRRLKRYLEIVRVKMHPAGVAQPAAEESQAGNERHRRFRVEDRPAVSRFLESVAKENREFHTGVAQSKLHVGANAGHEALDLSASPEVLREAEEDPGRLPPSLLSSLDSLLATLDRNFSNMLAVQPPGAPGFMLLSEQRKHPGLGEDLDSLMRPLDTEKSPDHWDQEHTAVRASVLHQGGTGEDRSLKNSHGGKLPAYRKELGEVNRLLTDLLFELNRRKAQWTS